MLEVREARISNFKGQLVVKMTKDAEPTMEKCVICGLGADVILEKKFMVRICHGCQEVTAATSDTQPPAVPGSGAAGGGGALEVPGSGAAGGGAAVIAFSKVKKRISKRSRTNPPTPKGRPTGVCCCVCFKQLSTNRRPGLVEFARSLTVCHCTWSTGLVHCQGFNQ